MVNKDADNAESLRKRKIPFLYLKKQLCKLRLKNELFRGL